EAHGFGGEAETLLALAKRLFRELAVGDVEMRTDAAHGGAVLVTLHPGAARNPAGLAAIRTNDAEFALAARVGDDAFLHHAAEVLAIVGMDEFEPFFRGEPGGARRQTRLANEQLGEVDLSAGAGFEVGEPGRFLNQPQPLLTALQRRVG